MTKNEFLKELGKTLRLCMNTVKSEGPHKYSKNEYTLPYKTGKLTNRGFRLHRLSTYEWELYIDTNMIPYAEYLDEPGKITQGFWDRAMEHYIQQVAHAIPSEIEDTEVESKAKKHFENQFKK